MPTQFKTFTAALSLALALTATAGSAADTVNLEVTSMEPQLLVVVSNGAEYTKLETSGTLRVNGHFLYNTGNNGRIKSWEVWPEFMLINVNPGLLSGKWYADHATYPENDRPFTVNEPVTMDVPAHFMAEAAVAVCNAQADKMRQNGASDAKIFGKNQGALIHVQPVYDVKLTGFKSKVNTHALTRKFWPVRCAKFSGPATPQIGTIRPSDPAKPWLQAPAGTQPDPVPDTRRPKRVLKISR